ncbi:MAG TPA: phosphatase domain-containing protein [Chryseosolibacter sp.]|nr:phosphatase domain-containing protein [Chryseosolibacter sp.]
MRQLKRHFIKLAGGIESSYDVIAFELRKRLKSDRPLQIVTYRSYGTVNRLYVKGRVLKDKSIRKSTGQDSIWNNVVNMYKRFESDEVPNAKLTITFEGEAYETSTDREGYFTVNLYTETPITWTDMWHEVQVALTEAPYAFTPGIADTAHVLVPPVDAEYGIISDIDDTIVKTTATSLIAMSRNTFFHNAHTRLPFAGVAEFYKSLQLGRNGKRNNPFFYVSSSPWNLYDLLIDFLDINDIPEGPLLLRDFGLDAGKESASHMGHKFKEIKNILLAYPHLNFVLIGDSGQEDPKIYREITSQFPGRILAIYIRDVQLSDREKIAIDISRQLAEEKVEMVIVDNTVEAAEHAAKNGLIYTEEIPKIEVDKKQDKGELPGKLAIGD